MTVKIYRPSDRILSLGGPEYQMPKGGAAPAWWYVPGKTCIAAYQPKGAASYAASKVNLANPGTYDATEGVAPAWDAAIGWSFDGVTQYLDTGVLYDTTGQKGSMIVHLTSTDNGDFILVGNGNTSFSGFGIMPNRYSRARWLHDGSCTAAVGVFLGAGIMGIGGASAYLDGVFQGTITTSGRTTRAIFIGAGNSGTGPAMFCTGTIRQMSIYSDALSADEVAAVSAAIAAL